MRLQKEGISDFVRSLFIADRYMTVSPKKKKKKKEEEEAADRQKYRDKNVTRKICKNMVPSRDYLSRSPSMFISL